MKEIFSPYLPSFEYVPDGEPHVFGDRLYLYGSHDRFDGAGFCLNDYVCWSAPVEDLREWRYEGIILRKEQNPINQNIPADAPPLPQVFGIGSKKPGDMNPNGVHAMWAPDVTRGPDGRYYLYYCLDFLPEICVAVCDSPAVPMSISGRFATKTEFPWAVGRETSSSSTPAYSRTMTAVFTSSPATRPFDRRTRTASAIPRSCVLSRIC